jgi:hypothetical protein
MSVSRWRSSSFPVQAVTYYLPFCHQKDLLYDGPEVFVVVSGLCQQVLALRDRCISAVAAGVKNSSDQ